MLIARKIYRKKSLLSLHKKPITFIHKTSSTKTRAVVCLQIIMKLCPTCGCTPDKLRHYAICKQVLRVPYRGIYDNMPIEPTKPTTILSSDCSACKLVVKRNKRDCYVIKIKFCVACSKKYNFVSKYNRCVYFY